MSSRLRPGLVLGITLLLGACVSPCKRVQTHHAEFSRRQATTEAPHVSLAIPFAVVDGIVAGQVRGLPRLEQRLPSVAGVSLGKVGLRVEQVRTRPAPAGQVGFQVRVGLFRGRQRLLGVNIQAVVRPVIDPKRRRVVVALTGKNIQKLQPVLDGDASRAIAEVVWKELPSAARAFTSKKQIAKLARGVGDDIMGQAFRLVKRELLDDLGVITRLQLELPDLPLERARLTTTPRDIVVTGWTTLPVDRGLENPGRVPGTPAGAPQLRLSGVAAAELGNYAMERGEIPQRWNLDGTPAPDGALHAALAWGGGSKPLRIHLWRLEGDCAHVRLDARPAVTVSGQDLVLRADDARVANVDGSMKVRAGVWFGGLGRQTFSFVERTAARVSFDVGKQKLSARVSRAGLDSDELRLGLELRPGR